MKILVSHFILLIAICVAHTVHAQSKTGYNASGNLNSAAVLELNNDLNASPSQWKALILPKVDFTTTSVFADSSRWSISGVPREGCMVFYGGTRSTNGFKGKGVYVWNNAAWRKSGK